MPGKTDKLADKNWVTTDDLATLLGADVDYTRHFIRKHKDILQPFKLGRENRMLRENVEHCLSLVEQNKIS